MPPLTLRNVAIIGGVLLLVGTGAAVHNAFFTEDQSTTVKEPISVDVSDTYTFETRTLYPGDQAVAQLDATNDGNVTYDLQVHLTDFQGINGKSGLPAARNASTGDLKITMAGYKYKFDLLNDGVANYNNVVPGRTMPTSVAIALPENADPGKVTATFAWKRPDTGPPSAVVDQHWQSGANATNCGDCHTSQPDASVTFVHNENNVTDDCATCHADSFEDMHMDCTSACHDSYPISANGMHRDDPSNPDVIADYRCHDNCHGNQLAEAHMNRGVNTCQICHGSTINNDSTGAADDIQSMHDSFSGQSCKTCHGIGSADIHRPYDDGSCSTCHS